jgi:hypothetical protein
MVMIRCLRRRATQPELGFTILAVHDVSPAAVREQVQIPVHGRQTDLVPTGADVVKELLRGPEAVRTAQRLLDGNSLSRAADPPRRAVRRLGHRHRILPRVTQRKAAPPDRSITSAEADPIPDSSTPVRHPCFTVRRRPPGT